MNWICSQAYMKKERLIEDNQQLTVEKEEYLYLYEDRIVTPKRSFTLPQVLDITKKHLSARYTFLYLHTIEGVLTYIVKSSPDLFISHYRKMKEQ
ncbi:hypothetical protein LCM10_17905 [Rossellomorea aquimaris]|uniref:hypothetical protein n=1 Tax=Rossellomorea aquimaris TaxID=189382 RepID=UPI001CD1E2FB|nr:hypothetical protein [Rossellomorea aquimaris]MCA1056842.1 hypothetical protein [Rossellomorea aquimaris]